MHFGYFSVLTEIQLDISVNTEYNIFVNKIHKEDKATLAVNLSSFTAKRFVKYFLLTHNIAQMSCFVKILLLLFLTKAGGDIINASEKAFVIKARKRMIDLGINQRILAKRIGVSAAYISQIFTGERSLTVDIEQRIKNELWHET